MNATPTANSTGRTVPAVMMGCHAGNFCCLNFVSAVPISISSVVAVKTQSLYVRQVTK